MLVKKYFRERINSIRRQDRLNLAHREVYTLKLLLQIHANNSNILYGGEPADLQHVSYTRINQIVDLGCGDKFLKAPLIELGCNYIGLDIHNLNFEKDKLNLADNSIDCILALGLIEHLSDPANLLHEIFRVLRPGGILYCSTPNFPLCINSFYDDPTHIRPYTIKSLSFLVASFGFVNAHCFPNLRVKPAWCYQGPLRFWRARWLFPIRADSKLPLPPFLKGKALGIFLICQKPS